MSTPFSLADLKARNTEVPLGPAPITQMRCLLLLLAVAVAEVSETVLALASDMFTTVGRRKNGFTVT